MQPFFLVLFLLMVVSCTALIAHPPRTRPTRRPVENEQGVEKSNGDFFRGLNNGIQSLKERANRSKNS